ncbi:MAG: helix-turn-helix transcriptional regulator [Chloroflexota bacterium]
MVNLMLAEGFGDPATPDLTISLQLSGAPDLSETRFDLGFGRFESKTTPGTFALFAPGVATEIVGPGPYELLSLSVPWASLQSRLESVLDRPVPHLAESLHHQLLADHECEMLMKRMWRTLGSTDASDALMADGLLNLLLGRLLHLGEQPIPDPGKRAKLHPRKHAAVLAYIDAYLGESLTLDDLANVAGCSRFHFARLFKASAGEPPLAYVTRQRVERAQRLMFDHPEWSLAAVALACGFSDQSHLNRHFKRIVGVTPGQYRGEAGR